MTVWKGKVHVVNGWDRTDVWRPGELESQFWRTPEDIHYAGVSVLQHDSFRILGLGAFVGTMPSRRVAWTKAVSALARGVRHPHATDPEFVGGASGVLQWWPQAGPSLLAAVDWFESEGGAVRALRSCPVPDSQVSWVVAVSGPSALLAAMPRDLHAVLYSDIVRHLIFARALSGGRFVHVGGYVEPRPPKWPGGWTEAQ